MLPWEEEIRTWVLTEGMPDEHTEKMAIYKSRREILEETNPPVPWSWASSLQNCVEIKFCCFNHPVCGVWLWQPNLTNTAFEYPCFHVCLFRSDFIVQHFNYSLLHTFMYPAPHQSVIYYMLQTFLEKLPSWSDPTLCLEENNTQSGHMRASHS